MPSLLNPSAWPQSLPAEPTASERFTRTLVSLTRAIWHPDCTFETAIATICEAASGALQIQRVSVWRYEADCQQLRCIHAWNGDAGEHQPSESLDTLPLDGDDYIAAMEGVRVFDPAEIQDDGVSANSHRALRAYLQRHKIHAVLDVPAFVGGELQGIICFESVLRSRKWSREEVTFAASMGDYVAMAFEIARRRRAEAELEHLRLHDAATGLPNREYMTEMIRQRLEVPTSGDEVLAVLHVLVDASGGVAWSVGTPVLEDVMARFAQRLRSFAGRDVDLARTRANGFSFVVLSNPAKRTVFRLAQGVLAALQTMQWDDPETSPRASIGITLAEPGAGHDARALLHQGEEAAGQAEGGDQFGYAIYDHQRHAALLDAMRQERALRKAFANGDLEVHYQPEYDAGTQRWVAAESLIRWRNGDRLVVAGEFISVLESSSLMLAVGRWVLRQACTDAVAWPPTADGHPVALRVNVSARQFDEPGLVDDVEAALKDSGLDPGRLCLELTESTLMRDIDHTLEILRYLRSLGVQLAIDDFGTGYASLVYLKRFPIDVLKIDRSFVMAMPDDTADLAIVRAIVSLAVDFKIEVVAEGVESRLQQDTLMSMGVHRMQGWLYGKAMENEDLCSLLASRHGERP